MDIHLSFSLRYFFFILVIILQLKANSQELKGAIIQDLSPAWKSIDSEGKVIPYNPAASEMVFVEVPALESNQHLYIKSPISNVDVWLGQQLIIHNLQSEILLDTLIDKPIIANTRVFIYSSTAIDDLLITTIIDTSKEPIKNIQQLKGKSNLSDAFTLGLTILLILIATFRFLFPHLFKHIFSNPLANKIRSLSAEESYTDIYSFEFLLVSLVFSLFLTLVLSYVGSQVLFKTEARLMSLVIDQIIILLWVMGFLIIKYFWSVILSAIYEFKGIPNIQIQDRLYFFIPVLTICILISLIDFSIFNYKSIEMRNTVIYALLISELFFSFWFFAKLDKYYPSKKLIIITYLCGTEFIPGTLALYWLVKLI